LSKLSETNKIFVLHFFAAAKNQVKSWKVHSSHWPGSNYFR
jgi:hypothetical protein